MLADVLFGLPTHGGTDLAPHHAEEENHLVRKRVTALVVAACALAGVAGIAAVAGPTHRSLVPMAADAGLDASLTVRPMNTGLEAAELLQEEEILVRNNVSRALKVAQDAHAVRQEAERQEQARREAEARRPKCVRPAQGIVTSGFGARWGTAHYGIDIANRIGTPILSVMDGTVVEAGPASGFGLWVRVQHSDGTITVYGHVDRILAQRGVGIRAGDQIATMGNRGQSTGPHLHLEVWAGGTRKINPAAWLADCGVAL